MKNHVVLQTVVGDLTQVTLLRGVEFAGDDEFAPFGAPRAFQFGPRIEQQIKPLVIADQAEKQRVAHRRIESQPDARFGARHPLAEIFEQRMRREERRSLAVGFQFAVHLLGHIDEAVYGPQVVTVEGLIGQMAFMRLDIVDLAEDLRMAVAARDARDGAEAGRHEGRPVFHQHEVGPLPADAPAHAEPVEGIDRIDAPADVEVGGRRRIDGLALAGEEQRRILQREGFDIDLVASQPERAGHDLHDRSQSPTVGVRRS